MLYCLTGFVYSPSRGYTGSFGECTMVKSLQLGQAFRLVLRTLPIAGVRLGVTLLLWLGFVLYTGAAGALVFFVGRAISWLGILLGIVALGG